MAASRQTDMRVADRNSCAALQTPKIKGICPARCVARTAAVSVQTRRSVSGLAEQQERAQRSHASDLGTEHELTEARRDEANLFSR
jgi:hypothetical protein